jgi:copper chaperone CopZ
MKTTIKIEGMHCGSCKALIEDVAKDVPGVVSCDVDVAHGKAVIEHAADFEPSEFIAEIAGLDAGYKAHIL